MSKSLIQFIIEEQRHIPGATGDFTGLLSDVVSACKQIAHQVNKGALIGVLGGAGSENIQGEAQKKLDVITNDIMLNALGYFRAGQQLPNDFPDRTLYTQEAVDAVDEFRRAQGWAGVPGLVDARAIERMWSLLEEQGKANAVRERLLTIQRITR